MTAPDEKVIRLDPEAAPRAASAPRTSRWPRIGLMAGVPLVAAIVALTVYMNGGRYETTDDARLRAPRVNISANVSGRVSEILVADNQSVTAGQLLFRLDPAPFEAAVRQARAELSAARLQVATARSAYAPRSAELAAARAELVFQERELERLRGLTERGVSPRREYDARLRRA